MIPVILSGGSGTRLWPLSRQSKPKQFLSIVDDHTLLQNTILRLKDLESLEAPLIVCNESHRFLVAEQLRTIEVESNGILLEPEGRNTAMAIAVAAFYALSKGLSENLLVLPSDHVINDAQKFLQIVREAEPLVNSGKLVTFGILPSKPETGYGYIEKGDKLEKLENAFSVAHFIEKPDYDTAVNYCSSGDFLWNAGMFLLNAGVYLNELKKYEPDVYRAAEMSVQDLKHDHDFVRVNKDSFLSSPSISIDYAVMERTKNAAVVSLDAGWNDIGSFSAVWEELPKDSNQNAVKGDVVISDANNCLAISEKSLIAISGVDNIVVVETPDAVMITSQDKSQDVKLLVDKLKSNNRQEATEHRQGFRPWGIYDIVDQGYRFQVKRITVHPGEKLSLQRHHHRAEHWVVVSGTAKVRCGNEEKIVTENQSTFIPLGELHQLSNPGKFNLELIEIQSGAYLGEDDIERFEDSYGRV